MVDTVSSEGKVVSAGVQELIERLKEEGVKSGRFEAERIISQAQEQAEAILNAAQSESEAIIKKAKTEADFTIKAGQDSLEMASRNVLLELKDFLLKQFSARLSQAVHEKLDDNHFLEKMILEVVGNNNLKNEQKVEVVLPSDKMNHSTDTIKQEDLDTFVKIQTHKLMHDGVKFCVGNNAQHGIVFKVKDKGLEVDLTGNAISEALLANLQPRFRALLEGIVK